MKMADELDLCNKLQETVILLTVSFLCDIT